MYFLRNCVQLYLLSHVGHITCLSRISLCKSLQKYIRVLGSVRSFVTCCLFTVFKPSSQLGGLPVVRCPRLIVHYICIHPSYLEAISSICYLRTFCKLHRPLLQKNCSYFPSIPYFVMKGMQRMLLPRRSVYVCVCVWVCVRVPI